MSLEFCWRLHVGCWPWDCCNTCDKGLQRHGVRLLLLPVGRGTLLAEAGRVPSQSRRSLPRAAQRYAWPGRRRKEGGLSAVASWRLLDFSFYRWVKLHPRCAGLAGGCPTCLAGLAEAEELDSSWMELCESLGVPLNLLEQQLCGQSVDYAGFTFDMWRGLMLIQDEKLVKLLASSR